MIKPAISQPAADALLAQLRSGVMRDAALAHALLAALMPLSISPQAAEQVLHALAHTEPQATESPSGEFISTLASGMLQRAQPCALRDTALAESALDMVGTGGDMAGTFNITTAASLLVAACGVTVIKHGNRAISSQAGSADVLAALGMPMPCSDAHSAKLAQSTGFCFLFAPAYHTSAAALGGIRRQLAKQGVITAFNLLGPLTNPAQPRFGVFGAGSVRSAHNMVAALQARTAVRGNAQRFMVLCGPESEHGRCLDEATGIGPFVLWQVQGGAAAREVIDPQAFDMPRCAIADLAGGVAQENAAALAQLFAPRCARSAIGDAVLLSAAIGLWCQNTASDIASGMTIAKQAITTGRAADYLSAAQRAWGEMSPADHGGGSTHG